MGCKLTDIPGYNSKIKAPGMQLNIDRGLSESPKMTEKELRSLHSADRKSAVDNSEYFNQKTEEYISEKFPKDDKGKYTADRWLDSKNKYIGANDKKTSEYEEFQATQSNGEKSARKWVKGFLTDRFADAEKNARGMGIKEENIYGYPLIGDESLDIQGSRPTKALSKQKKKKKIVPKNKKRTKLGHREFWVYTVDSEGNRTRTIYYENYDGSSDEVIGTTQRY